MKDHPDEDQVQMTTRRDRNYVRWLVRLEEMHQSALDVTRAMRAFAEESGEDALLSAQKVELKLRLDAIRVCCTDSLRALQKG